MKFEIAFNSPGNPNNIKAFYEHIGAQLEYTNNEYPAYYIEVESLEKLEELNNKINLHLTEGKNNWEYSMIITFDPPVIYLDKEV